MKKQFCFTALNYFFKHLVFSMLPNKRGLFAVVNQKQLSLYSLYQALYATFLVYKNFWTSQNQIFLLSSSGIGRYNYQLFQYTNYYLNPRMDPREYTTRISSLSRKPYLNLFGYLKRSSGLYINLSRHGALVLRHLSQTQNVAASVALTETQSKFQIDYPLSLKNSVINEKYYLHLLVSVTENQSRMTRLTQHLLYYKSLQKRK